MLGQDGLQTNEKTVHGNRGRLQCVKGWSLRAVDGIVGARYKLFIALAVLWGVIMPVFAQPSAPTQSDIWDLSSVEVDPSGDRADISATQDASWVDSSHDFVTLRANNLTQWIDRYFGGAEVDHEAASSRLRLRLSSSWDERLGTDVGVRLGGKVNLPALSERLDLVFRGDDPVDDINGQEDPSQSRIGLQYQLGASATSPHRFDLTLGVNSSGPRPGMKYRYRKRFSERDTLRFTQRLQYEFDDGVGTTSRIDFDHIINQDQLIRSYSRLFWGEESDGLEWSTSLSHIARWRDETAQRGVQGRAAMVFAEVSGVTQPFSYISNYRVGLRLRRHTYRDYLFLELEPSYNWRIDAPTLPRRGAWQVELRLEFLLFDDLRRKPQD